MTARTPRGDARRAAEAAEHDRHMTSVENVDTTRVGEFNTARKVFEGQAARLEEEIRTNATRKLDALQELAKAEELMDYCVLKLVTYLKAQNKALRQEVEAKDAKLANLSATCKRQERFVSDAKLNMSDHQVRAENQALLNKLALRDKQLKRLERNLAEAAQAEHKRQVAEQKNLTVVDLDDEGEGFFEEYEGAGMRIDIPEDFDRALERDAGTHYYKPGTEPRVSWAVAAQLDELRGLLSDAPDSPVFVSQLTEHLANFLGFAQQTPPKSTTPGQEVFSPGAEPVVSKVSDTTFTSLRDHVMNWNPPQFGLDGTPLPGEAKGDWYLIKFPTRDYLRCPGNYDVAICHLKGIRDWWQQQGLADANDECYPALWGWYHADADTKFGPKITLEGRYEQDPMEWTRVANPDGSAVFSADGPFGEQVRP